MASSKKDKFQKDDMKLAKFARALSHPARIVILRQLASLDSCCFSEISKEIPLADSTVSQHIFELKSAGLIQGSYEAPKIKYCINDENWKAARKYFKEFMKMKAGKTEKD